MGTLRTFCRSETDVILLVLSLCSPIIAIMTRDPSEIGYVPFTYPHSPIVPLMSLSLPFSIRFGVSWFIAGFGFLMGNPILGALLGDGFVWKKAILWAGVSRDRILLVSA
jgi:hypothetical protein